MAKVLISFLGTGRKDNNNTSKYAYEDAHYKFDDGEIIPTSFFADAMMQHYSIDKVLLIGTSGSMWGEVYNHFCQKRNLTFDENFWLELSENCEKAINSDLPPIYCQKVEESIGNGSKVVLMNYGLTSEENIRNASKFLDLVQDLKPDDELFVDITHSFRSLPMYMMNLLLYMKVVSKMNLPIKIFYGMFEASFIDNENRRITPVVDISEIDQIMNWIIASYAFMEYGNGYKVADLLVEDGQKSEANRLKAFSDTMNLGYLEGIRKQVGNINSMRNTKFSTIPQQFLPVIIKDFCDRFREPLTNSKFQYVLAKWHFEHKNYASSYLVLQEAILTYVQEVCKLEFPNRIDNSDFAKIVLMAKKNDNRFSDEDINNCRRKLNNFEELSTALNSIIRYRNDIAHQRNDSNKCKNSDSLIQNLRKCIENIAPVFKTQM